MYLQGLDENLGIYQLPLDIYHDLVKELSKDKCWKIVAEYVLDKLQLSREWIQNLEFSTNTSKSPVENLLSELDIRMCTLETLTTILKNCNLLNASSVFLEPELLSIVIQPDTETNFKSISLGENLLLDFKATGLPPPNYQWYHNDLPILEQRSEQLNIKILSVSQKGSYKCKASQINHKCVKIYEVFSKPVFIDIEPSEIKILKHPPNFIEVKEGDCLKLSCHATGYPNPQYQWYRDNNLLENQVSNELKIYKFTDKLEGKYYCHIFNEVSEKFTETSTVMINLPPQKASVKVALLIANENYFHHEKLSTPKNDVAKISQILNDIGFHTICLTDLTYTQMKNVIKIFCNYLKEGAYGVFYFAGHGFKMQENYMLSIDAPKDYLRKQAICESELLSLALKSDPSLFVEILDMCQTLPPLESNPNIHTEIPSINEYIGKKNLRNLLQAYSTSSYRPSYERLGNSNGLYTTHLCKYLGANIPVTKVFEQVGKSIDKRLTGTERRQIPMFATTITKPYRLTDGIFYNEMPESMSLEKIINFPETVVEINFKKMGVKCKAVISSFRKPFLNCIQVSLHGVKEWDVHFYKSVASEHVNIFQKPNKRKCWILSPQIKEGPLVISLLKNGVHVGATLLEIVKYTPLLWQELNLS